MTFVIGTTALLISIPTPAKGVTHSSEAGRSECSYFNSHPREGGDAFYLGYELFPQISIPTPARGVTP